MDSNEDAMLSKDEVVAVIKYALAAFFGLLLVAGISIFYIVKHFRVMSQL